MMPSLPVSCCWDCLKMRPKICACSQGRTLNTQIAACPQHGGVCVQSAAGLGNKHLMLDTTTWECDLRTCFLIYLMLDELYYVYYIDMYLYNAIGNTGNQTLLRESGFGWVVPFCVCYMTSWHYLREKKITSTMTIKEMAQDYCDFELPLDAKFPLPCVSPQEQEVPVLWLNVSSVGWEGSSIRAPAQCFLSHTPVELPTWDNSSYLLGFILLVACFLPASQLQKTQST